MKKCVPKYYISTSCKYFIHTINCLGNHLDHSITDYQYILLAKMFVIDVPTYELYKIIL